MGNLIIFVVIVAALLILFRRYQKSEILSFLITLLGTLVGVSIAIYFFNNNNKNIIKMLETSIKITNQTFDYTSDLEQKIIRYNTSDTISKSDIKRIKKNNPIPSINLLETIITDELIYDQITEFSRKKINTIFINLKETTNYNSIEAYKENLKELIYLLKLERDYQKNILTLNELKTKSNNYGK